jgi:hypothetical protein
MKFEWDHFDICFYYPTDVATLFRSWSTCDGLKSFFIEEIEVLDSANVARTDHQQIEAGDQYSWQWRHGYSIDGKFNKVIENQEVEFTFGSMRVNVTFKALADSSLLHLRQTEIPLTENDKVLSHMNCRICWTFFLTNLKSVILNGTDLRDPRPERASSFEIGFKPPKIN